MVDTIVYDGFGNITSESAPATGGNLLFQGMYYDRPVTEFIDGARAESPSMGRFTEDDPIGFRAGDANLYRFVGNNATNFTDPSGLAIPRTNLYGAWETFSYTNPISSFFEATLKIQQTVWGPSKLTDPFWTTAQAQFDNHAATVATDVQSAADSVWNAWNILANYRANLMRWLSNPGLNASWRTLANEVPVFNISNNTIQSIAKCLQAISFYQSKFREVIDWLKDPSNTLPIQMVNYNQGGQIATTYGPWSPLLGWFRQGIRVFATYFDKDNKADFRRQVMA